MKKEVLSATAQVDPRSTAALGSLLIGSFPAWAALTHVLLFVGAFCFYSTLWPQAPVTQPDSGSYLQFARDLSDLHIDQLHERTPGYPIFLLLTGSAPSPDRTLFHVSLLLHLASIWFLSKILSRVGISATGTILFALVVLLPPFVEPAAYVLTETLAETMLVSALASLVLWQLNRKFIWIVIAAATIAYAALTRPTYQLSALAVASWFFLAFYLFPSLRGNWRELAKGISIIIAGSILLLGGYSYFNYRNFGFFGITYKLGISLTQKTVHVIDRLPDEYAPVREALIRARNADLIASGGTSLGYIEGARRELTQLTGLNEPQLGKYLLKLNLLLIRMAPLNYLQEVIAAFGRYWFPTSTDLANFHSRYVQTVWAIMHICWIGAFAINILLVIGATALLRICSLPQLDKITIVGRRIDFQEFVYGLAGTIVAYTAAISCIVDVGDPRHRVPTDVLIVFMLFLGTDLWRRQMELVRAVLKHTASF